MGKIDADALKEVIHGMYLDGESSNYHSVDADGDTLIGKFAVVDAICELETDDTQSTGMDIETVSKIIESVADCCKCPMRYQCNRAISRHSCAKKWAEWLKLHKEDDFRLGIGTETIR